MRTIVSAAVALALVPGFAPASGGPPAGCTLVERGYGPQGKVRIRVERIVSGLVVPWSLAFLPGGDVLVTERSGNLRLVANGRLLPEPVARVPVAHEGEGGLLGLALDPRFAENHRFYVYFTADERGRAANRVVRWVLADDHRSAREDRVLLSGIPAAQYHDGGRVRFGPDGRLYVGTGDGTDPAAARDRRSPNGKILRITTDGAPAPGNPFPGSPVFALGLRNVEAFDFLGDGALLVADHGPSGELGRTGHDRVLVVRKGADLGWPEVYGCEALRGREAPLLSFVEAVPPGGGSIYRGSAIPEWRGSFLVGTLRSRHLLRVALGPDGRLASHEVYLRGDPPEGLGRIRDVVEGPDGALWLTTSNCDGRGTCPPEKDVIARIVGE